jgi:hypothetical protein
MDLIIQDVPATVWENLDRKAKASGRTIAAEAKALLEDALREPLADELDDLQRLVARFYGNQAPEKEVDELIADRRREAKAEDTKL